MREAEAQDLRRCRYGGTAVWLVRGHLAGAAALRLARLVDLHFGGGETALLLDLREAGLVDSAGAEALGRCRRHDGFRLVGLPSRLDEAPLAVRLALTAMAPASSLVAALVARTPAVATANGGETRRHPRLPAQIPVEVLLGDRAGIARLDDIGPGGVGLGMVPRELLEQLAESAAPARLELRGLEDDPLARDLARQMPQGALAVRPVYVRGASLGASFLSARPPV